MDLELAIKGIHQHRESLLGAWDDPNALSEVALKLSTYNSYLADHIADLHRDATSAQAKVFKEYKNKGSSDTGAEAQARFDSVNSRRDYENIKHIYTSTDKLINVTQTRIRTIENQIRREGEL